jgi:hypothetical protein
MSSLIFPVLLILVGFYLFFRGESLLRLALYFTYLFLFWLIPSLKILSEVRRIRRKGEDFDLAWRKMIKSIISTKKLIWCGALAFVIAPAIFVFLSFLSVSSFALVVFFCISVLIIEIVLFWVPG